MVQAGKPASGKHFIGREEEVALITKLLLLGQSVVIIAPRRFGKTTLVNEILRQVKSEGLYSAYIDVFSSPTIDLLSAQITEAVLKNHKLDKFFAKSRDSALSMMQNIKLRAEIEDFEFILGFTESRINTWSLLRESIHFIDDFSKKHGRQIICAFDEFGDIRKLDGDKIVKLFRSIIQNQNNASYIFSGSYESVMDAMFVKKNSPFFRFARIINLDFIEKKKFLEYFIKSLSSFEIPAELSFLQKVLDFTEGHPYYSQLALQTIIVQFYLTGKISSLESIEENMLHAEQGYLEKTWEEIASSKENIQVLLAVATFRSDIYSVLKGKNINIYRGLTALIKKGIIIKINSSNYKLSDPLLRAWILKNITKGLDSGFKF